MNVLKIIPNNSKWVVSKNIIYIDYIAKIPILVKNGDDIWVYLDVRIAKYVIQLVKILQKNKIDFLFKSTLIFFDHKFSEKEFHEKNLSQYIRNISDDVFFDGFQKIEFDYTENIANYLKKYKCYDTFQEIYRKVSIKLLSKRYDWYANTELYNTKREDIRDYIATLQREIKINLLF